jgi:predicted thioesterase
MDLNLQIGLKGKKNIVVSIENTAIHYGSGLVEVFATPAMIALMETTALESIEHHLPDGFTTVGTEVCVKHIHASDVGSALHCESRLNEINGRKLVFEVSVWDEELLVGHGTHTRFVVDKQKFIAKFNRT